VRGHLAALDGLGIERFDLYGSHTGANIACEIAIAHPQRVRRLILDGVSIYSAEERADMLANYAPAVPIDHMGSQLYRIWHFVRDVYLFWPWYKPDAAHARKVGLPPAGELHDKVVEVLKATRTYHLSYRAAIAYEKEARLPLVKVPTLLACAETDMFMQYFAAVQKLMPSATPLATRGSLDAIKQFEAFLEA
jgi:pimeloyl-ACP methyl ester carboxylesterase